MISIVIKRDGNKEKFDISKIERVVQAAGLEKDNLNILSNNLNQWSQDYPTQEVNSLEIRDQVLNELKKLDPITAGMFDWYQKTKSKN